MRLRLIALLVVVAGVAAPAGAGEAVPLIQGPDVPTMTEPDSVLRVFDRVLMDGCKGNVTAARRIDVPEGEWDRVILRLDVEQEGDPWDRLFLVSLGGVEVMRGTTPRTSFTLRRDVTEYLSLLPAGDEADVAFTLGTWVGAWRATLDLEFYGAEPTAEYVRRPWSRAHGIFHGASLTGNLKKLTRVLDLPATAPAAATVELLLSNHGDEEAQFRGRLFRVYVDGKEIAVARAMPYTYAIAGFGADNAYDLCTGPATDDLGDTLHPVVWWTAQRALDDAGVHLGVGEITPYRAQVDPADLPLLAGRRTIEVVQISGTSYWVTSLNLLVND